ncbi:MAG: hypothetical protein IKT55_07845 [Clostridia bacterium]|nr:hypothetical protein [Clostridia bacterium]
MKMAPIKKLVLCIAAVSVAMTIVSTNIITSVLTLKAAQNNAAKEQAYAQQVQQHNNSYSNGVSNGGNNGGYVNNGGSNSGTANNGTVDNGATNNAGNGGGSAADKTPAGDNGGYQDSGSANNSDKAAIVEEFNKAVNSVKTNATTVEQKGVTNYLAGQTETGGLNSIYKMLGGDDWLDGMLRDNSQGAATYTGADITAKFPVEGQTWSSKLTAADVKEATRTEENGVITITIVTIADEKSENVKIGEGHAPKAFNVVLPNVVNDNIPGAAKSLAGTASMAYPESTAKITVDAKTGNVITADYDMKWTINFDKMSVVLPLGTKAEYTVKY